MVEILEEILELSDILPPFSSPERFTTELARMPFATACAAYYTSQLYGPAPNEVRQNTTPPLTRPSHRDSQDSSFHQPRQSQYMETLGDIIDHTTVYGGGSTSEGNRQGRDTGRSRGLYSNGGTRRPRAHINGRISQRLCVPDTTTSGAFDSQRNGRRCSGRGGGGDGGFARSGGDSIGSIDLTQRVGSGTLGDGGGGRGGNGRGFSDRSGVSGKCVNGEAADLPLETEGREGRGWQERGRTAEGFASASNVSGDTNLRRETVVPAVRRRARSLSASFGSSLRSSRASPRGHDISFPFPFTSVQDRSSVFAGELGAEQGRDWKSSADRLAWTTGHLSGGGGKISGELEHRLLGELNGRKSRNTVFITCSFHGDRVGRRGGELRTSTQAREQQVHYFQLLSFQPNTVHKRHDLTRPYVMARLFCPLIVVLPAEITATASVLPRLTQQHVCLLGQAIGHSQHAGAAMGVGQEDKSVTIVAVLEGWRATVEALEQSDRYNLRVQFFVNTCSAWTAF